MENAAIAEQFSLLSKLMDIHGENAFKSKTYSIAAYRIEQLPVELRALTHEQIFAINGIGDAIGKKIIELTGTGKMASLEALLAKTPAGILEMMKIKGLGPKKIAVIWKEMQVENIGELLYACHENRLSLLKGFGKKTQDNVIDSIEFFLRQKGNHLYAGLEPVAAAVRSILRDAFADDRIELTGAFARQLETLDRLLLVVPGEETYIAEKMKSLPAFQPGEKGAGTLYYRYQDTVLVGLLPAREQEVAATIFENTNTPEFNRSFFEQADRRQLAGAGGDRDIFATAGLQYIEPCLRESGKIIALARQHGIPPLIQPGDIRGIIHCHSKWSDGADSLETLALSCIEKGYEYLVISDHSKSAFYAQGLQEERVREQHRQVDELNGKLSPFRIFKSIESDILNDGSLDYSDALLSTFDLVIASVHSNLKMPEEKAMSRLIRAIENPYTTILGHLTGRLLLSRKGYPVDHEKIIDACAAHHVAIEINAHPRRLDMGWQWLEYALSKNVLVSINPDAHSVPEFGNTRFGVLVAQKGMVTPLNNLSSYGLQEFERFLEENKRRKKDRYSGS